MKTQTSKKTKTLILVLLLALFCPMGIFAQQLITFKSGLEVNANILSQSQDSLCYQALDNLNKINCVPKWMIADITDIYSGSMVKAWKFLSDPNDRHQFCNFCKYLHPVL